MTESATGISLTAMEQKLLLATVVGGWLVQMGVLLHDFSGFSSDIPAELAQIGFVALPILFFAISFWFSLSRFATRLQRLSYALILTIVASSIYNAVQLLTGVFSSNYYARQANYVSSYWQSYGTQLISAAFSIIVFIVLLVLLKERKV